MARIIRAHPHKRGYLYHIFTDLDFWDTRKILKDLLDVISVRRNFGKDPDGDIFPTQVVSNDITDFEKRIIERRLKKAIVAPPRHVVVRTIMFDGRFEFKPYEYYPAHWDKKRIEHFTWKRLPIEQTVLCSPYHTVKFEWKNEVLIVRKIPREKKHDPIIVTLSDARKDRIIPSGF